MTARFYDKPFRGQWMRGYGIDRLSGAGWILVTLFCLSIIFSTALVQTSAVLLLVVAIVGIVRDPDHRVERTPLDLPVLAFVVARVISIPLSVSPSTSLPALHTEIFFYILFFVFTNLVRPESDDEMLAIMKMLLLAGVIAALVGSAKVLLGVVERASSTSAGYYTLGLYLAAVLPLPLVLGGSRDFLRGKVLWLVIVVILLTGIALTFNRLHWLAAILLVMAAGIMRDRRLLIALALGGVVLVLVVPGIVERLEQSVSVFSHMSGRDVLWRGAWMLADQHPFFGFGLKTFTIIFPLKSELPDPGVASWHNDYLQVYMESGLVGLVALLWLIIAVYYHGIRAYQSKMLPERRRTMLLAIMASLTVFFVVGGVIDTLGGHLFRVMLAFHALTVGLVAPRGRYRGGAGL